MDKRNKGRKSIKPREGYTRESNDPRKHTAASNLNVRARDAPCHASPSRLSSACESREVVAVPKRAMGVGRPPNGVEGKGPSDANKGERFVGDVEGGRRS